LPKWRAVPVELRFDKGKALPLEDLKLGGDEIMRVEFRTLKRVMSTLVVLCVLFIGMGLDASAQRRGRDWGRSHNRGRHLGWTRGRRVGQNRRDDGSTWRRLVRRDRRQERRMLRRERRSDRRSGGGAGTHGRH
jgi:hypothetical protein